jgi:hypothetical protein
MPEVSGVLEVLDVVEEPGVLELVQGPGVLEVPGMDCPFRGQAAVH